MSDQDQSLDPFIEEIASELRRPVRLDARFDERVMTAIEAPEVIPLRPTLPRPWILRPWTISVSPLGAFAAAAAVAAIIVMSVWSEGGATPEVVKGQETPVVNVSGVAAGYEMHTFLFVAPDAQRLVVVGDFNDWDETRTPMTRATGQAGMWSVTVPLAVGNHQFQFVKDDTLRLNDPSLPQVSSDFGSPNSIITIARKGRGSF